MKSKLLPILLAGACLNQARADFNPVALTPGSYTYDIVVESNAPGALPFCINATTGSGTSEGDNTYFEQGYYAQPGQAGGNLGVPVHNTVFTNINNANVTFQMPPVVATNNTLQLDTGLPSASFDVNSGLSFQSLAVLEGGSGPGSVTYTVTHSDASVDTGTLSISDWFTPAGIQIAWGCNARVNNGGGFDVRSTSAVNNVYPYLYSYYITIAHAAPITNITFNYTGSHEANFYSVSGEVVGGTTWAPVSIGGWNRMTTVPAIVPPPTTATMDSGTNNTGNTWF